MPSELARMEEAIPAWLDLATRALLEDLIATLADERPDMLAALLYGSIARHDERSIDVPHPSDVDLLIIFDTEDEQMPVREGGDLFSILGKVYDRHLEAPRDVKVMFASRTLREWDSAFIDNVARDGILLWARGPLPVALATVA